MRKYPLVFHSLINQALEGMDNDYDVVLKGDAFSQGYISR